MTEVRVAYRGCLLKGWVADGRANWPRGDWLDWLTEDWSNEGRASCLKGGCLSEGRVVWLKGGAG
jgi:hypothetical protein